MLYSPNQCHYVKQRDLEYENNVFNLCINFAFLHGTCMHICEKKKTLCDRIPPSPILLNN